MVGARPIPMNEYTRAEKLETKSNPLRLLLGFVTEHWSILLFGVLAAVAFLYSEKFAEFIYALLRFIIVVLTAMTLRDLWFKKTIRPYVSSESFADDFASLEPVHKVWMSVVIMISLLAVAAACFIHP